MTHDELVRKIAQVIMEELGGFDAHVRAAIAVLAAVHAHLQEVTPEMVEAWEAASPIPTYTTQEYQDADAEGLSRAHATGNWLAMLDASPLAPKKEL